MRLLGAALERLPAEQRAEAERTLLDVARSCGPVTFGRRVRRYLAEHAARALRGCGWGDAPTVHGARPHVVLVVDAEQIGLKDGVARFAGSSQPITLAEAGTLLTDCTVSRLAMAADGTPLEAGEAVRTVPIGLWRALVARDGGCRWEGCDAPASWCDVAHGQHPFRAQGRRSPASAVLRCRRHHRRFDKGSWRVEIVGDEVTFHRKESAYVQPLDRVGAPPRPGVGGQAAPPPDREDPGGEQLGFVGLDDP